MKKYENYIFDFDGTITDTAVVWLNIFRAGLIHFGVTPPDDKTLAAHTHNWAQMPLLGLNESDVPGFATFAHAQANERLPEAPLHVGAREILEYLVNNGKRVAIYSGMDRAIFEPAIEHHDLHTLVEVAVAGDDAPRRKPYPDGIHLTLELMNIQSQDYDKTVYIGDKDTDIIAARNAGVDSILYFPIAHQVLYDLEEVKLHNPTATITDWQELAA